MRKSSKSRPAMKKTLGVYTMSYRRNGNRWQTKVIATTARMARGIVSHVYGIPPKEVKLESRRRADEQNIISTERVYG